MNKTIVLLGVTFCLALSPASIPLDTVPSWSSQSNDYSTGGGFWDIDTNGYIDFCMSNGNDMAIDHNAVYLNQNGTLENPASWRSADSGYFGHLYLGDVDNDGLMDMAVGYLQTSSTDHRPRVYRNVGGALSPSPWWKAADTTTHFDCCLGDVNLDGYLDLAIAAGDIYSGRAERLKLYLNHGGTLDTLPAWQSANQVVVDAVRFADLNNDGRLDLIAGGKGYLYVYYQSGETLEHNPSWVDTLNANTYGLRLAVGDYNNDGWPDVACVCNGQNDQTHNCIRVYHNNFGALDKPALWILQRSNHYSSCVAWGDANNDGFLDLAAGGWWEPVVVYENHSGMLDTVPGWSWQPANLNNLVCESVLWGDIRNRHLVPTDEMAGGDGVRKLFRVTHVPFQGFSGIDVNGTPIARSGYCFDPLTGYITLRDAPNDSASVVFHYTYSACPDLGVTNWEPSDHNYVFYNNAPSSLAERSADPVRARLDISSRFGSSDLRLNVSLPDRATGSVAVFTAAGRKAAVIAQGLGPGNHNLNWSSGNSLTKGVYFIRLSCSDGTVLSRKTIRIR